MFSKLKLKGITAYIFKSEQRNEITEQGVNVQMYTAKKYSRMKKVKLLDFFFNFLPAIDRAQ